MSIDKNENDIECNNDLYNVELKKRIAFKKGKRNYLEIRNPIEHLYVKDVILFPNYKNN